MTYFVGNENRLDDVLDGGKRYFYALRRTDDGLLYFAKVDQIMNNDTAVIINDPGLAEGDFEDFEQGVDFFDGRQAEDHSRPYANLHWDQYRWDNKSVYYYINDNGEFVVRMNKVYTYPPENVVTP